MEVEDARLFERSTYVGLAALIAVVPFGCRVIDAGPPVTMISATAQLRVERVGDGSVDCADFLVADAGDDVLVGWPR